MTPEQLAETLKTALGPQLRSVVLYGSAAAGDHLEKKSDYNVLVVLEQAGVNELRAMSEVSAAWAGSGNRPPLVFTLEELRDSADTFPIELADILQSRKVLLGDDPVAGMKIGEENLRLQIEHELKGKLLRLREGYLLTRGNETRVLELITSSLSTFLVLFRAALRLWQSEVPAHKREALKLLAGHVGFDPKVFDTVSALKEGQSGATDIAAESLFEEYLATIEQVIQAVDRHIHAGRR